MPVLRFLAMLLFLVAAIALATDATRAYWGSGQLFTPLAQHWNDLAPNALAGARRAVSGSLHPAVWDWMIAPLLKVPAWIAFAALAIPAAWFGRRRRRVNIYAN